jgi:hypothetical protein
MKDEIDKFVCCKIFEQVRDQAWSKVKDQVSRQVYDPVLDQVKWHIWGKLNREIKNERQNSKQ